MLALKLQGEARHVEGSWSRWQEAKLLAKLVARLKREGLSGEEVVCSAPTSVGLLTCPHRAAGFPL